ncbi:MAG TPA: hypothetical protein VGV62_15295 [Xanthobacteraceae bacterium]|jgi:apolipoprotein N-acyltransferase|nr:hypothetical protein [Xanthobacteraceae bacterium]
MFGVPNLSKLSRNWPLVGIAGVVGLAFGIAIFVLCGTSWVVAMLTQASTPVAALLFALPFALGLAAIEGLLVNHRRRKQTRLFRAPLTI